MVNLCFTLCADFPFGQGEKVITDDEPLNRATINSEHARSTTPVPADFGQDKP
jgi:hypothetical protein